MKKLILLTCLVLAAVLLVSACGKEEDTEQVEATGETKEFTINAKNFEFDQKEIKVKKGDTVKITLNNEEGFHAVKIDGYDEEVQGDKTITFDANKTGEFNYVCSIFCGAGHADMVGKLIVE